MLELGILKNFDSGTYKATVQLAGSLTTYFDDISVVRNIPSASMVVGNYVILAIPGGNPRDACVIATWPQGSSGGGAFLDLSDTPSSYSGQSLKPVRVNSVQTALEFASAQLYVPLSTPASIYRHWSAPVSNTPRTATISSISGDVITLTANEAYRFWCNPAEADPPDGNMYLKIANTSRAPVEYAWVKDSTAVNKLTVTDPGDISGWSLNDVISTAEDGASSKHQELDISPLIPDGAKGIMTKLQVEDSGATATLIGSAVSKEGTAGTLAWCFMQSTAVMNVAYPASPIQTNRHLFVRDNATGTDTLKIFIVVLGYFI